MFFFNKKAAEIKIIQTPKDMIAESRRLRGRGRTIALVPTMGFFHEGHLSLMREAGKRAQRTVTSIFVNPAQFGPGEDFDTYPRDMDRDMEMARNEGVDIVFAPVADDLYGPGFQTYVEPSDLARRLCGRSRPHHFRGVLTVVSKLFHMVRPHVAVFGEKDYQQLVIVKRMVRDLDFDVEIAGAPIVREKNGLAMSSRNARLKPGQTPSALSLFAALGKAREMVEAGTLSSPKMIGAAAEIIQSRPETSIDYISICDPDTLEDVDVIERPALMALAVRVGKIRLIDNALLCPKTFRPN
ncbi:Pantothenate synthetase [Candidatus Desulfarcum epimagneticum]|uniref:Pantothenate synthetase n=1 Tax=uncultured Desulfobacteraceae bacterium TaxID=218296 RepID=A0A484HEG8_9BACT|nr:Pantothenate synthetase [uncultured Desulfobacteraceae bacterium]